MTDQLKRAETLLAQVTENMDKCVKLVRDAMNSVEAANTRLDPSKKSLRLKAADFFGKIIGKGEGRNAAQAAVVEEFEAVKASLANLAATVKRLEPKTVPPAFVDTTFVSAI